MKNLIVSVRMLLWMSLLTGVLYPLVAAGISRPLFKGKADGSLVSVGGRVVGSSLIAQKFAADKYFWPRPSAAGNGYDPTNSGGSNLGPTSAALVKAVADRRTALVNADPGAGEPPQDLLFASGSGLDPHISPEAALYQVARVAKARAMDPAHTAALQALVESSIEGPDWGLFGQSRVNVLNLNLALDAQR
jgi:K+-transporting ATPase ATPase C chain